MAIESTSNDGNDGDIEVDTSDFEGEGEPSGQAGGRQESRAEAEARERAELAELLGGADDGEGDQEGEGDGKPKVDKAKADKAEPKPKKDGKGDDDQAPQSLAKNWKAYRKSRAELDARAAELAQREAKLTSIEADRAKASQRLTALERLASGDPEALDELGLDVEALTKAYLARQSGEKAGARQRDPEIEVLRRRLDERDAKAQQAEQERAAAELYQQAVSRFNAAAAELPLLKKLDSARREQFGNALAFELQSQGRKVPPPEEIASMLERRLRDDYQSLRQLVDDQAEADQEAPPPPPKKTPRPISSRDRAERGGARRPAAVDERDAERAELVALLRGA